MVRFDDGPEIEVRVDIAAHPAAVWDLVSDINLPARFQDEFLGAEWLDEPAPAAGARFVGRNARQGREWETTSWVVDYEPERVFSWAVGDLENPGATWTYRLEAHENGTKLIFHRRVGPGWSGLKSAIEKYPDREEEIIAARDAEHRRNMQAVLEGVKALAEGTTA